MTKMMKRFAKDESGATAVEYGLLVSLIAVALTATFTGFKGNLDTFFKTVGDKVKAAG